MTLDPALYPWHQEDAPDMEDTMPEAETPMIHPLPIPLEPMSPRQALEILAEALHTHWALRWESPEDMQTFIEKTVKQGLRGAR